MSNVGKVLSGAGGLAGWGAGGPVGGLIGSLLGGLFGLADSDTPKPDPPKKPVPAFVDPTSARMGIQDPGSSGPTDDGMSVRLQAIDDLRRQYGLR